MSIAEEDFKAALARWASGVTVVTAAHDGVLHGMTASSFTSVSLSPPLISICLDRGTRTLPLIESSGHFAVNVLGAEQAAVSNHFASSRTESDRLGGQTFSMGTLGCPLLAGALAHLQCKVFAIYPGGDHVIVLGEVATSQLGEGDPLLYFNGAYRALRAP